MRFLMIWHPTQETLCSTHSPEHYAKIGAFIEQSFANGTLLSTGGINGGSTGIRIRNAKNKVTVLDGPFSETKEVVGGYALCEFPDLATALAHAKQFLELAGDGESEIHQLD